MIIKLQPQYVTFVMDEATTEEEIYDGSGTHLFVIVLYLAINIVCKALISSDRLTVSQGLMLTLCFTQKMVFRNADVANGNVA